MRRKIILSLFLLLLFVSCSQFKELRQQQPRANVSLPKLKQVAADAPKELVFTRPDDIIFVREDGQEVPLNVTAEWDSLYQENVTSINIDEVVVVASDRRNVPERNGKIGIEFIVSVPRELQHKNRLLYIQPILMKGGERDSLPDLRFTGKQVRSMQEKQYAEYERYLGRIIPDSVDFYTTYVKHQAYENYLSGLQDEKRKLQQRWAFLDEYKEGADPLFTRFHYFNRQMVRNDSLLAEAFRQRARQKVTDRARYYEKREADTLVYANQRLTERLRWFNQKAVRLDTLRRQRWNNRYNGTTQWGIRGNATPRTNRQHARYNDRYAQWMNQWQRDSIRLTERFFDEKGRTYRTTAGPTVKGLSAKTVAAYNRRFSYFNEHGTSFVGDFVRDTIVLSGSGEAYQAPDTAALRRQMNRLQARYALRTPLRPVVDPAVAPEAEAAPTVAWQAVPKAILPMYGYQRELPDSMSVVRSRGNTRWRESLETDLTDYFERQYQLTRRLWPMYHLQREIAGNGDQFKQYSAKQQSIAQKIEWIDAVDSAEVMKKFYDKRKIARNERLKKGKEKYFERTVRFPYGSNSRLDSVTVANDRINYHYRDEVDADENSANIKLFLAGRVEDAQGRHYVLPPSDTLTYFVSSMTYFVQKRVRYLQKTIYRDAEVNFSVNLDFPVGKSLYQPELKNNQQELKKIKDQTIAMLTSPEYVIDSLMLTAKSSPEGAWSMNERLAKDRAMTIRGLLQQEFAHISDSLGISSSVVLDETGKALMQKQEEDNFAAVFNRIKIGWVGEDWASLSTLIAADTVVANKEKILALIQKEREPDRREYLIRSAYAKDYAYLREQYYPTLRSVAFRFSLHRRGMVEEKVLTNVPDTLYAHGVELLEKRAYKKALEILRPYDDVNTAVAYMSLGYNEAALRILDREPESAHVHYMKAVVYSRLNREKDALIAFLHACELQPRLKFRGNLDPELSLLIKKYGLFKEDM